MPQFDVRGVLPSSALKLARNRGWTPGAAGTVVVVTTQAVVPRAVPQGFVWVSTAEVSLPALQAAVDAGAIDVVVTTKAGWEARLVARLDESLATLQELPPASEFVADSAAAKQLLRQLHQAASSDMPVLLTGETGTGKELASRLVHSWSTRSHGNFVPINCSAIPNELMEGELFGYVRGAFSGASRGYDGQIAAGEGGTVFLDEIDDTPRVLQNKLLRVLEDKVISRLGENVWTRIDFRLVAATNRDLKQLIAQGQFGDDLFERISTVQIVLPPLRERLEDLPGIVLRLVKRFYAEDPLAARRHQVASVTEEALEVLRAYRWPGNVRELRNVVYGALVVKRSGDCLLVSDLPRRLWQRGTRDEGLVNTAALESLMASGRMNLKEELAKFERVALVEALRLAQGNAAEAARILGEVGRGSAKDPGGTVRTMMRRHKL